MKKIGILLIGMLVISLGMFSGCTDLTDQLEKKKGIDEKAIIIILTKRRELQIYDILLDNLSNQSDEQIHEYTLRALIELYSIDKLEKILEDYKKKTITILTEFAH